MVSVIATVLKARLENLTWVERVSGMVRELSRPIFAPGADNQRVKIGVETFPVSCDVNVADCFETGIYKALLPDSSKSAVAFFVDNGGATIVGFEGPGKQGEGWMRFSFDIKFLCWLNLVRLGEPMTAGGCLAAGRMVPYFIRQLIGQQSAAGLFDGGLEEQVFQGIEVKRIREMTKTPSMFAPFSFATDTKLFNFPYDYFGLQITGEFVINAGCLPEFGEDWEPFTGCLAWDGDSGTPGNGTSNWFNAQILAWMASRPVYESNDAAAADLAVGATYWASSGEDPNGAHNSAAPGTFMRVV